MRSQAWGEHVHVWLARPEPHAPCQREYRSQEDVALCPERCVVTRCTSTIVLAAVGKSALFASSRGPRSDSIRARGSVSAGAEPRGTWLVPSGCLVPGLAGTTCRARARQLQCAARRFGSNVSNRLPQVRWASPFGRARSGRRRMIPAAARGCPGRERVGGRASPLSKSVNRTRPVRSESQSRRCRSVAGGSPHVRPKRSPGDLARGDPRAELGGLD